MTYDIVVVGGGIVGLSFAMQACGRFPELRLAIVEKEPEVAQHQTGHNSGVIHSGVYYKPRSRKARMCVSGAWELKNFCAQHGIPVATCGKLILACNSEDAARLDELLTCGQVNGIQGLRILGPAATRELEPSAGGVRALHVPSTGITDYAAVARKFAEIATERGAEVHLGQAVVDFRVPCDTSSSDVVVRTTKAEFSARYVVNCAGLYSDRIARMAGHESSTIIVPFRGEYYDLAPASQQLVRGLIYPVPNPKYPFLGVHFTRRIHGKVDVGPNAVLAFRREGYRWRDFDLAEASEIARHPGFRALARREWRYGLGELARSMRKRSFLRSCQRLVPAVRKEDIIPGGAGVRAQAVAANGQLVDDFLFLCRERFLHVLNVPSPAATASLPIGREILNMLPVNIVNPTRSRHMIHSAG